MPDRIMQSKPAKHGKHLNDRTTEIKHKSNGETFYGSYKNLDRVRFMLQTGYQTIVGNKKNWTVEEIVESEG